MRNLLKFAALAAAMIVLLATIQWVRSGDKTVRLTWDEIDRLIGGAAIGQLAAAAAVAALLARETRQPGRSLGIALGAGLAVVAFIGVAPSPLAMLAPALALIPALGLVIVLAEMRRWRLLWLAAAALLGVLLQGTLTVLLVLGLGRSM